MSRKDYVLIAQVIRAETYLSSDGSGRLLPVAQRIVDGLAEAFSQDNPRFDKARFLGAIRNGKNVPA